MQNRGFRDAGGDPCSRRTLPTPRTEQTGLLWFTAGSRAGSGLRGQLLEGAAGPGGTTGPRFDWRHRAKQIEVGSFDCSGGQFWVISAQAEPDLEGKRCCRANGNGRCWALQFPTGLVLFFFLPNNNIFISWSMFLFQWLQPAVCCGSHHSGSVTFGLLFRPERICVDSARLARRLNWISYHVCICCQYTGEDHLFLKAGYCVGKTKRSSHSLRKCYGKGGRGWRWGQIREHWESSGKVFLVTPVCWQWVRRSAVAGAGEDEVPSCFGPSPGLGKTLVSQLLFRLRQLLCPRKAS